MIDFNKIVNKVLKKGGKILFQNDIFELIDPEKKDQYKSMVAKTIYRLKSQDILRPIRNGVYIVPTSEDKNLNELDILEKYYFHFVKKYITHEVGSDYFISSRKALSFHLKDFSIPEKLIIVNRKLNKKVMIGNYELIFKTISHTSHGKSVNLYAKFSKMVKSVSVDGVVFKISSLELALVESALISDNIEGIDIMLLTKAIKKYSKFFHSEVFYAIGELKYIMAFNRLKEISKNIDRKLYEVFLDIIKKNGGLFIGEGLRKIY